MDDVFQFRNQLVERYRTFLRGFVRIRKIRNREKRKLGECRTQPLTLKAGNQREAGDLA